MMNWKSVDPYRIERGVQTLLRKLHPTLRSFDGSGGDGGKDAELVTADGHTVFEVKSFTRLDSAKRRQIEQSLKRAVMSAPAMTRWVLIVPVNMTPRRPGARGSEQAWFEDKLPLAAPGVELNWWGLDWLDGQVAAHADVQRYIEGADSQLLDRAREFNMEQAALAGGAADAHERMASLRRRVDEISMFWTLDISVEQGRTRSILRAKLPESPILDPIRMTPTIAFRLGDPEAEALQEQFTATMDFGGNVELPMGYVTALEIDASDEARLLLPSGDPTEAEFTLKSERVAMDRHVRCFYQVIAEDGSVLHQFPVFIRERTSGGRGATFYGSDAASVIDFEVRVPRPTRVPDEGETMTLTGSHLTLNLPATLAGFDVDSLMPVYEVLGAALAGRRLRFEMPGLGSIESAAPLTEPAFPAASDVAQFVSDLQRMQALVGSLLRFPEGATNEEVRTLRKHVRMLEGEVVEHSGGLTMQLKPESAVEFARMMRDSGSDGTTGGLFYAFDNEQLKVGSLTLDYGYVAFFAPHPKLTNLEEIEALTIVGEEPVEARFEPTDAPFRWLSREQAESYFVAGDSPELGQPGPVGSSPD